MLQVVQYQKNGLVSVEELPSPLCHDGGILVKTAYSLISAGTEKTSVTAAQSSVFARAKRQPEQVRLVMDTIKAEGLFSTIKKVQTKLDSYKTLGYSVSGVVIQSNCPEFSPGDFVAAAGAGYANHAELVSVPKNLAVKLPQSFSLIDAAYTTLGAIAMQGFRQSEACLGESVAVIGLGLIGLITVQLLKAAGCRVVGLDVNESIFETAMLCGCEAVYTSGMQSAVAVKSFARGLGCDSVIVTAGTSSNEPLELALEIARKKGKVVIVGAVGMNVPREPFYKKEIDLRISCSYGPGRYDPDYEEKGIDYPPGYVRWTENRNMMAFVDLLAAKRIDMSALTSHVFPLSQSPRAYDLITGKTGEPYLGVIIEYPDRKEIPEKIINKHYKPQKKSQLHIGFVGAGSFAQSYLLPPLRTSGADMVGVSASTPVNASTVAKKFGFRYSTADSISLIADEAVNAVFCATRHDSHARYVIAALDAGKPIFVEKPLAVSHDELMNIEHKLEEKSGRIMVGFNRRFSQAFRLIDTFFEGRSDPMTIFYRVNAGFIPKSHWVNQEGQGGRIIGEACHFIDCMVYLTRSFPISIYAVSTSSLNSELVDKDNASITIKFSDGSVGVLHYIIIGDKSLPKEYCEVYCQRMTAIMNNFKSIGLYSNGKSKIITLKGRKGHNEEIRQTLDAMTQAAPMPISFPEIKAVTLATFAANQSLSTGLPVELSFKSSIDDTV